METPDFEEVHSEEKLLPNVELGEEYYLVYNEINKEDLDLEKSGKFSCFDVSERTHLIAYCSENTVCVEKYTKTEEKLEKIIKYEETPASLLKFISASNNNSIGLLAANGSILTLLNIFTEQKEQIKNFGERIVDIYSIEDEEKPIIFVKTESKRVVQLDVLTKSVKEIEELQNVNLFSIFSEEQVIYIKEGESLLHFYNFIENKDDTMKINSNQSFILTPFYSRLVLVGYQLVNSDGYQSSLKFDVIYADKRRLDKTLLFEDFYSEEIPVDHSKDVYCYNAHIGHPILSISYKGEVRSVIRTNDDKWFIYTPEETLFGGVGENVFIEWTNSSMDASEEGEDPLYGCFLVDLNVAAIKFYTLFIGEYEYRSKYEYEDYKHDEEPTEMYEDYKTKNPLGFEAKKSNANRETESEVYYTKELEISQTVASLKDKIEEYANCEGKLIWDYDLVRFSRELVGSKKKSNIGIQKIVQNYYHYATNVYTDFDVLEANPTDEKVNTIFDNIKKNKEMMQSISNGEVNSIGIAVNEYKSTIYYAVIVYNFTIPSEAIERNISKLEEPFELQKMEKIIKKILSDLKLPKCNFKTRETKIVNECAQKIQNGESLEDASEFLEDMSDWSDGNYFIGRIRAHSFAGIMRELFCTPEFNTFVFNNMQTISGKYVEANGKRFIILESSYHSIPIDDCFTIFKNKKSFMSILLEEINAKRANKELPCFENPEELNELANSYATDINKSKIPFVSSRKLAKIENFENAVSNVLVQPVSNQNPDGNVDIFESMFDSNSKYYKNIFGDKTCIGIGNCSQYFVILYANKKQ